MKRYPGLQPFSAEQKDVFFGREDDIKELSNLIFIERKVLLYSKSGYGKTSLLNAGVIPKLKKENPDFEFINIRFRAYSTENKFTPSKIFLQSIAQLYEFKELENNKSFLDEYAGKKIDRYDDEFKNTYWFRFKKNQLLGNHEKNYIFIFDQFEELFSYPSQQIDKLYHQFADIIKTGRLPLFVNEIKREIIESKKEIAPEQLEMLYDDINVQAVFSIREDRLSELNYLADKIPDIQQVFYQLAPLDEKQAREAIEEPAKAEETFDTKAFNYEEDALDKIINALSDNGKQKIETPQLQIVCKRIEDKRDSLENDLVRAEDIPDFKDIFLNFYRDSVSNVKTDEHKEVYKFIEYQLIIGGRRISLDEFVCQRYVKPKTLTTLVDAFLLRAEPNNVGGFSYELSHDTLIEPIADQAEKRRKQEEAERLRARQRRQIRIISLTVLVAAISIGAAIFGIAMWLDAVNSKSKLIDEQFKKNETKAYILQEESEYKTAIQFYQQAIDLKKEEGRINDSIKKCEKLLTFEPVFNENKEIADSLFKIKKYWSAIKYYYKAQRTGYQKITKEIEEKKKIAINELQGDSIFFHPDNKDIPDIYKLTISQLDSIRNIKY